MSDSVHQKPYWHADLKWIAGILLVIVLQLLSLIGCMVMVTSEPVALDAMGAGLAAAYKLEKGFNDITEINQLKRDLKAHPQTGVQPVSGFPVSLSMEDISSLSEKIRQHIFQQVARHIYNGETDMDSAAPDGRIRPEFIVFRLITRENHDKLITVLLIWGGFALVLLTVLIVFSFRFGRMASPGFAIIIAGLPGAIFFNLLKTILHNPNFFPRPDMKGGLAAIISYIVSMMLPPVLDQMLTIYYIMVGAGLLLILAALAGRIIWGIISHVGQDKLINKI